MKQKILIGAGSKSDKAAFYQRLQVFLNPQHEYFFTFLCLDYFQEPVLADSDTEELSSPELITMMEFEMKVEALSAQSEKNINVFKPQLTPRSLHGLTKVADLLIIDSQVYEKHGRHRLSVIIEEVNCPVLVLPRCKQVSRLIMVHDPNEHSINMVKHFLRLSHQDLTKLPLSVLFAFPDDDEQTENEKFFVEYLKMSFPNLGLQLMTQEPIEELVTNLNADSGNAIVMVSQKLGVEILNYSDVNNSFMLKSPLFIHID
ncbi:MAG: hypothetical protein ACI9Z3_002255 [Roseivirga sp.]